MLLCRSPCFWYKVGVAPWWNSSVSSALFDHESYKWAKGFSGATFFKCQHFIFHCIRCKISDRWHLNGLILRTHSPVRDQGFESSHKIVSIFTLLFLFYGSIRLLATFKQVGLLSYFCASTSLARSTLWRRLRPGTQCLRFVSVFYWTEFSTVKQLGPSCHTSSPGGLLTNIDAMVEMTRPSYSGPGTWADADMLQVCRCVCMSVCVCSRSYVSDHLCFGVTVCLHASLWMFAWLYLSGH